MTTSHTRRPRVGVAIVTGGSRGVGRETVHRLVSRGYAVVVNYVHDQRAAESTVEAVLAGNGAAVAVRADVADDVDVERLFDEAIEAFDGVDIVVHAVRSRTGPTPVTDIDLEDFDALCRINTRATLIVNREAARQLRNGGAIVNLSSSAAVLPNMVTTRRPRPPSTFSSGCSQSSSLSGTSRSTVWRSPSTGRARRTGSPMPSRTWSATRGTASPAR